MSLTKACSLDSLSMLDKICNNSNINFHQDYFSQNFKSINIINRGGFGIVFRAFHQENQYAIKIVPFLINKRNPENLVSCRINNKLKEVRCLEDLTHPNIISYYFSWIEIGNTIKNHIIRSDNREEIFNDNSDSLDQSTCSYSLDNDHFYSDNQLLININIKMELMDMSLREYLLSTPLLKRPLKKIIPSVLSAVSYLHSKNIIHCDLKPENILLRISGDLITSIKIGDFGLVMERVPLNIDLPKNSYGTPTYMPPEVKNGIIVDKYDIYSLAIIIYEIVNCFSTQMERSHKLQDFKNKGKFKTDLDNEEIEGYLLEMIDADYTKRPNINQVINNFMDF